MKPMFANSIWQGYPYIAILYTSAVHMMDKPYTVSLSKTGDQTTQPTILSGANLGDVTGIFMFTAGRFAAYERVLRLTVPDALKDEVASIPDVILIERGHAIPEFINRDFREIVHPMGTPMSDFRQPDEPELSESSRSPEGWVALLEARLLTGDRLWVIRDNTRHTVWYWFSLVGADERRR